MAELPSLPGSSWPKLALLRVEGPTIIGAEGMAPPSFGSPSVHSRYTLGTFRAHSRTTPGTPEANHSYTLRLIRLSSSLLCHSRSAAFTEEHGDALSRWKGTGRELCVCVCVAHTQARTLAMACCS